jgi:hypothetical protein
MKQRDVLVVGLNPALQRSVTLPNLVVGAVNRGASVQIGIGGKGQDVVVAAASMAAVPQPVLLQLLGKGAEGDTLLGLIKAVQPHTFVNSLSVRTQARCRTAITLVDASRQEATEIVEPSGTTSAEEVAMLLLAVERQYFQDKAGGVALMGSMPPGCPPTLYADVLQRVVDARSKVLLDTATGVDEALRVCRDVGCAALLKVNARELCALAGMPAATAGAAEAAHATPASTVLAACAALADKLGLATAGTSSGFAALAVAVTDGPYPAYLVPLAVDGAAVGAPQLQQQYTVFPTPPLPRPLANPIGAGDAVASGTLLRWCDTVPAAPAATTVGAVAELTEAFAWGLACGAASCLTTENSVFALDDALALRAAIVPRPQG